MTNHWRDLKNADLILINGANPAEAHPVGFQWFIKAKLDPDFFGGQVFPVRQLVQHPRLAERERAFQQLLVENAELARVEAVRHAPLRSDARRLAEAWRTLDTCHCQIVI